MKKSVTVKRTQDVEVEIEVEFPYYSGSGGDTFTSWTRVLDDFTAVTITEWDDDEWQIEFEKGFKSFNGRLTWASTAEKFNDALERFKQAVNSVEPLE
jgi:hypothetical protein